eukprot:7381571-Prymnesium_polylepis.2
MSRPPHTKNAEVNPSSLLRTCATMSVPLGHLALQRRMASCRNIFCISVATGRVRKSTISSDKCDSNCLSRSGVMCSSPVHGKLYCRDNMSWIRAHSSWTLRRLVCSWNTCRYMPACAGDVVRLISARAMMLKH